MQEGFVILGCSGFCGKLSVSLGLVILGRYILRLPWFLRGIQLYGFLVIYLYRLTKVRVIDRGLIIVQKSFLVFSFSTNNRKRKGGDWNHLWLIVKLWMIAVREIQNCSGFLQCYSGFRVGKKPLWLSKVCSMVISCIVIPIGVCANNFQIL